MDAVQTLKRALGTVGRGDFETTGPGDITWPREKIAVFVQGCLQYGCETHGKISTPGWKQRSRINRDRAQRTDQDLASRGWTVVRFFECEVTATTGSAVDTILDQFDSVGDDLDDAHVEMETKVRVAIQDLELRVGQSALIRFLSVVGGLGASAFRRKDVEHALIEREGWAIDDFKKAWRGCMHHQIIRYRSDGVHTAALFKPVMKEMGIK